MQAMKRRKMPNRSRMRVSSASFLPTHRRRACRRRAPGDDGDGGPATAVGTAATAQDFGVVEGMNLAELNALVALASAQKARLIEMRWVSWPQQPALWRCALGALCGVTHANRFLLVLRNQRIWGAFFNGRWV